jgi:hypothetical protein
MEYKRHQRLWQSVKSVSITDNLNDFIFTFGFVRSSEGVVSVVVDMDDVAGEELGNFVWLGIVLEVHFAYAVQSIQHITILLNMFCVPSMTYATVGPG